MVHITELPPPFSNTFQTKTHQKHLDSQQQSQTQSSVNSFQFAVHVFYEGFPSWVDGKTLKTYFMKMGKIQRLFISRKHTKAGKRFGFVTIASNFSDKVLTECMNDLRYRQYNLKANIARHFKKSLKVTEKKLLGKTKHKAKQFVPKKERDSRSYKEVLSPSKTDHVYEPKQSGDTSSQSCVEEVRYNINIDDSLWLTKCLIGTILDDVDYMEIRHRLIQYDISFTSLRFLGASKALISFAEYDVMDWRLWRVNRNGGKTFMETYCPWKISKCIRG